jgi:predicted membrane protein
MHTASMEKPIQERLRNKRKIEKEEESVKPTIINDSLIKEYIRTYNKENKIFDMDDMPIWELQHLSLSFKSKPFHCNN